MKDKELRLLAEDVVNASNLTKWIRQVDSWIAKYYVRSAAEADAPDAIEKDGRIYIKHHYYSEEENKRKDGYLDMDAWLDSSNPIGWNHRLKTIPAE